MAVIDAIIIQRGINMISKTGVAITMVSLLSLSGCAANDLMLKRQAETEAKIEHLIQISQKTETRFNLLESDLASCKENTKLLSKKIGEIEEGFRILRNSQDEVNGKLSIIEKQNATPKVEIVNAGTVPKGDDAGPPSEYVKAFGLYSANNFADAIAGFEAFIKGTPQSEYVPNALYWIGECHYSLSDLPKAKEIFFKVAGTYPNSSKAPDALLKLGYTLLAMKEKDKANAIFESLIKSYPSSPAAIRARQKLTAS